MFFTPIGCTRLALAKHCEKNICGVSVVGSDFEELKRYNLSEIFDPTPIPPTPATKEAPL